MKTEVKNFSQLSKEELHHLMKLRVNIFVVEQKCAYQELDDYDRQATHLLGYSQNELVACARILPTGTLYENCSIGRVAVKKEARSAGLGRKIFGAALAEAQNMFPNETIKIQAQVYLEKFYTSFGFKTVTEPYPDIGVWHVDMLLET